MASIKHMLPDDCQVLRNGSRMTITATDIVPGDILYIKAGSKPCADIRFVEVSSDIKLDRSILTGKLFKSHLIVAEDANTDRRIRPYIGHS